jgi:dipeptidyl aminopeptidase/acylaminoacyl peptidase
VYTADGSLGTLAMAWRDGVAQGVAVRVDTDHDVWDLELDPDTHEAAGPPERRIRSTASDLHPQVSPDGRELAFVSRRSGRPAVWLAGIDGARQRQLTYLDNEVAGYPRWSPDGRRIVFHATLPNRKREIYSVDAAEGIEQRLFEGCCPTWARDGKHLYVTDVATADDANTIARVRIADGRRERLFVGELAVETADGRALLYAKELEPGVFLRSLDGDVASNSELRLVADYTPALGGIVPVADGFFYLGHTPEGRPRAFRFYDFAGGAARDVAPAPRSTLLGLAITPDGRHLLYSAAASERGGDLVVLRFR